MKDLIFTKHHAGELNGLIQRCIICGTPICDYTNAMTDTPGKKLPSWPAGAIFQTKEGNPIVTISTQPDRIMYPHHNVIIENYKSH